MPISFPSGKKKPEEAVCGSEGLNIVGKVDPGRKVVFVYAVGGRVPGTGWSASEARESCPFRFSDFIDFCFSVKEYGM